ncbi:MAG: Dabb family protein [Desulfovibrionales bacterium]|nr:Dabb family protein [Desulfovibrionales bacterium]
MIKHIVWFTLKEENADANADKAIEMLTALQGVVPTLNSIEVSKTSLETSTEAIGFILQTTHDTPEGLHEYNVHPAHQECVAFIKQVVTSRRAIDYVI